MKKSTRVLVTGPLEPYAAGYQRELARQGYSPWTAVSYLYSFARVSRWLAEQGLTAADWMPSASAGSSPSGQAALRPRWGGRRRAGCSRCWAICSDRGSRPRLAA